MATARARPRGRLGVLGWLRRNLFSSALNSVLSVVAGVTVVWAVLALVRWIFVGANWEPVWNNLRLLAVYRYPAPLLWRPLTVLALLLGLLGISSGAARGAEGGRIVGGVFWWFSMLAFALTLVALLFWPSVRWWWLLVSAVALAGYALGRWVPRVAPSLRWLWWVGIAAMMVLLYGTSSSGPMRIVVTRDWGGFMLTIVLAAVGIVLSFPLGIALAVARRSNLPAIKYFAIAFIEIVRGAPLITWLFIASLMVPLLLDVSPDSVPALMRAMVAITLFSSAYMAENVRGGLQAVPLGQSEAARALGLSGTQTLRLIVLPQALRAVIPAIVGQAIALFKDTSLVFIVGLLDFFEIGRRLIPSQPASLQYPGGVLLEVTLFMAAVYWFFCYRMSVASRQLEEQLGVGQR